MYRRLLGVCLTLSIACLEARAAEGHWLNPDLFVLDDDRMPWDIVERHLARTKQPRQQVDYYDLSQASHIFIERGFDTLEGVEDLYQARKRVLEQLGYVLPRLQIAVGPTLVPLLVDQFLGNLLGFMMPYNWFKWLEARQFYDARKFTYLNTMLDRLNLLEVTYLRVHEAKMRYGMSYLFRRKVLEIARHFRADAADPEGPDLDPIDVELFGALGASLNGAVLGLRREALASLPQLGTFLALREGTGNIDIERLDLPQPERLPFLIKDDIVALAKTNSLELESLRYMIKAAEYTKASEYGRPFTVGTQDYHTFGLSFGLDSVASVQISHSQVRALKIQYERVVSIIDNTVSELVLRYNETLKDYHEAAVRLRSDYSKAYEALRNTIVAHNTSGVIKTDLHQIEFVLEGLLRMNQLRHDIAIYQSSIDRYLVQDKVAFILNHQPVGRQLEKLKDWAGSHVLETKKKHKFVDRLKRMFAKRRKHREPHCDDDELDAMVHAMPGND